MGRIGAIILACLISLPAMAQGDSLPAFMSLDTDKANLRTGPSQDYPIEWVLVRRGLPLEVLRRYGRWAQVKDPDGAIGWLDAKFLSSDRQVIVSERVRTLFAEPKATAPALYRVEPGVIAHIVTCRDAWCQIDIAGKTGWLPRIHAWGTYPNETVEE